MKHSNTTKTMPVKAVPVSMLYAVLGFIGIGLVGSGLVGCASTPSKPNFVKGDNYAYTKSHMSQFIKEQMDEYDMTGVSVALVDGSKANPIVWAKGFGYADKENKIPATADTLYRAGSITKLFTAIAIMQLAEQGKLDIDKPIQTYLPNITIRSRFANSAPVTIRNMLTHHSGLQGNIDNGMWGDMTADISELANKTYDLVSPPNTQHAYSNVAMAMLGLVIENVSGKPYEDYIKDNLLLPMSMNRSYVASTLSTAKDHAKGYFNGKNHSLLALRDTPAGGLNTSVADMAKFAYMTFDNAKKLRGTTLNGQRILSAKTLSTMQTAQKTGDSPYAHKKMGLAWYLKDVINENGATVGQFAGHDGTTFMFNTVFKSLPREKLAVVVMANGLNEDGVGTDDIASKLMQLALASKSGIRMAIDQPLPNKQPTPANDLQRISGKWVSGDLGVFDIKKKGDKLKLVVEDNEIDLVNRGGTYYPEYKLLGLMSIDLGKFGKLGATYQKHGNREVLKINSASSVYNAYAEKLKPQPLSSVPDVWKTRLGKYQTVNSRGIFAPKDVVLTHEDGLFIFKMKAKNMFSHDIEEGGVLIKPIDENRAIVTGVGRGTGDVIHFKTQPDGHVDMHYSGYVYQKLTQK